MGDRKLNKIQFGAGIFVLLCALLMIAVQLHGRATYGEKLRLGVPASFMGLSAVLIAVSHHRRADK